VLSSTSTPVQRLIAGCAQNDPLTELREIARRQAMMRTRNVLRGNSPGKP
jgi:hypothetical protein